MIGFIDDVGQSRAILDEGYGQWKVEVVIDCN
jgi:hypothetical protein